MSLDKIKSASDKFKNAMKQVETVKEMIKAKLDLLEKEYEPLLTTASNNAAEAQNELALLIDGGRENFVKPKKLNLNGVEVGLHKAKDVYTIPNEDETIRLIEEIYKKKSSTMIRTEKTVINESLKSLKAEELEAIGVIKVDGLDEVFIKIGDSDISKVVKGLLKESPLKSAA